MRGNVRLKSKESLEVYIHSTTLCYWHLWQC